MRKLLALILMVLITACSGVDDLVQSNVGKDDMPGLIVITSPASPTKADMGANVRVIKKAYDGTNLLDYDTLNKCYCEWKYIEGREVCTPMFILPADTGLFVDSSCSMPLFRQVEPTARGEEFCGRFYNTEGKLKFYKWTRTEFRNYWFFLKKEDQYGWKKTCTGAAPFGEWSGKENTILDPVELSLNDLATK